MTEYRKIIESWWDIVLSVAIIAINLIWHIRPETIPAFLNSTWFIVTAVIAVVGIFVWLTVSSRLRFKWQWWFFAFVITLWTIAGVKYLIQ